MNEIQLFFRDLIRPTAATHQNLGSRTKKHLHYYAISDLLPRERLQKSEAAFEALINGPSSAESNFAGTIDIPTGPSEIERTVKTRRLQRFFRNAVLTSYDNRCALTGMAVPQLLVASHIIPWSENEKRRADPTNGLCLNVLHDKAFDRHLITFDKDYRLVVSDILKRGDLPEFQSINFGNMEGSELHLPHRFTPAPQALEEHRNDFIAA